MDGNGLDLITDSYSMEVLGVVIAERLWSKYAIYQKDRDKARQKLDEDKRIDSIDRKLAEMKGKQDTFEKLLNGRKL